MMSPSLVGKVNLNDQIDCRAKVSLSNGNIKKEFVCKGFSLLKKKISSISINAQECPDFDFIFQPLDIALEFQSTTIQEKKALESLKYESLNGIKVITLIFCNN